MNLYEADPHEFATNGKNRPIVDFQRFYSIGEKMFCRVSIGNLLILAMFNLVF